MCTEHTAYAQVYLNTCSINNCNYNCKCFGNVNDRWVIKFYCFRTLWIVAILICLTYSSVGIGVFMKDYTRRVVSTKTKEVSADNLTVGGHISLEQLLTRRKVGFLRQFNIPAI